jgi:hypothetical protein
MIFYFNLLLFIFFIFFILRNFFKVFPLNGLSYLTVIDRNVFDWVVYDLILKIELIQLV